MRSVKAAHGLAVLHLPLPKGTECSISAGTAWGGEVAFMQSISPLFIEVVIVFLEILLLLVCLVIVQALIGSSGKK
jgi:hypothetical protein